MSYEARCFTPYGSFLNASRCIQIALLVRNNEFNFTRGGCVVKENHRAQMQALVCVVYQNAVDVGLECCVGARLKMSPSIQP